ncbi:MAG: MoaD/ThiS family protein [Alphaproteobacteria bacterium]|nr:MoaD/ThiS family protein [Alphaproteobacteria bacterium]
MPDAVVVELPAALVALFPGSVRRVEVAAGTGAEAIDAIGARWPGMRDRICDSRLDIRRHMRVFVDGERATLATPLRPGAEVFVMTAISGG